jgi:MazG family protein
VGTAGLSKASKDPDEYPLCRGYEKFVIGANVDAYAGSLHRGLRVFILVMMPIQKLSSLEQLLELMAKLRDPETGCPWDVEQTFDTIAPYTLEEAYEVDHAIRTGDMEALCDELGDLLLQVVFHSQMAAESDLFNFDDVAASICDKLVRRHPHIFVAKGGDGTLANFETAEEQTKFWEDAKAQERAARNELEVPDPFEGVPVALPALARATKLHKRASRLEGVAPIAPAESEFDVSEFSRALAAVVAVAKSRQASKSEGSSDQARALIGQLLERCVRASRELGVDPEDALRAENFAFEARVTNAVVSGTKS